jgi:hypothetical protein
MWKYRADTNIEFREVVNRTFYSTCNGVTLPSIVA